MQKFRPSVPDKGAKERSGIFLKFYNQFIDGKIYSDIHEAMTSPESRWKKYDYVITGSDQVWNRAWCASSEGLRFYYLQFAERRQRVSYAPSFGLKELPVIDHHIHKQGLLGFDKLSCRETSGCSIIRKLTGKEAELVLDPTLLLTSDEWRRIARKPEYDVPKHYCLVYLLGADREYFRKIHEAIRQVVPAGIELLNISGYIEGNMYYHQTGPQEFLWLVDNADHVFTNSFHGTLFSVNYRKNFISFWKEHKGSAEDISRLQSLLSMLGLMTRLCSEGNAIPELPVDYHEADEKLRIMRESSMDYLRGCLE